LCFVSSHLFLRVGWSEIANYGHCGRWVDATRVGETIIRVIEEEQWEAGSVVEVSVNEMRVIKAIGDEGPQAQGCVTHGDPAVAIGAALKGVSEEFGN